MEWVITFGIIFALHMLPNKAQGFKQESLFLSNTFAKESTSKSFSIFKTYSEIQN